MEGMTLSMSSSGTPAVTVSGILSCESSNIQSPRVFDAKLTNVPWNFVLQVRKGDWHMRLVAWTVPAHQWSAEQCFLSEWVEHHLTNTHVMCQHPRPAQCPNLWPLPWSKGGWVSGQEGGMGVFDPPQSV